MWWIQGTLYDFLYIVNMCSDIFCTHSRWRTFQRRWLLCLAPCVTPSSQSREKQYYRWSLNTISKWNIILSRDTKYFSNCWGFQKISYSTWRARAKNCLSSNLPRTSWNVVAWWIHTYLDFVKQEVLSNWYLRNMVLLYFHTLEAVGTRTLFEEEKPETI